MHWKSQSAPQPKREISVDRISQLTLVPLTIASLFGLLLVVSIVRQPTVAPPEEKLPPSGVAQQRSDHTHTGPSARTSDLNAAAPPRLTPLPSTFASASGNSPARDQESLPAEDDDQTGTRHSASLRESMDLTDLVRQNSSTSNKQVAETATTPANVDEFETQSVPARSVREESNAPMGLQLEAPRPARDDSAHAFTSNEIAAPPRQGNTLDRAPVPDDLQVPPNSTPALPELRMPQPSVTSQISARPISNAQSRSNSQSPLDPSLPLDEDRWTPSSQSNITRPGDATRPFDPQRNVVQESRSQTSNPSPNNQPLPGEVIRPIAEQVRHGGQLASKGALFSARDELQHALYLIANARSTLQQSNKPTEQLEAAMTAMREADEFSRQQQDPIYQLDLAAISTSHRTPVLKGTDLRSLSPIEAARRYYEYAGQNLIDAMGREPVAAEALYSLGKLHIMQHGLGEHGVVMPIPKAVIYFQAAVMIDAQHHRAANELGVQLARLGEFAGAREALLMSVATQPSIAAWRNLAYVHQQLNERQLAQLAENEAVLLERQEADKSTQGVIPSPNGPIQFVPASQFSESDQTIPAFDMGTPNTPSNTPSTAPATQPTMDRTQANRPRLPGRF